MIPSKKLLSTIELLLTNDAADWAEINYDVINILSNPEPDSNAVAYFKNLFQKRFPTKSSKVNQISFDSELQNLRQKRDEFLLTYYKRVLLMMQRVGAKNRPISGSGIILSFLRMAMLDSIIRAFIRGLIEDQVKLDSTKMLAFSERFLRGVYILVEESRRTKKEFQKFKNEQAKQEELNFLRDVVQRNMTSIQIQALRASYHNKDQSYLFRSDDRHRTSSGPSFHTGVGPVQPGPAYQHPSPPQVNIPYQPPLPGPYQPVPNLYQPVNHYQPGPSSYQSYQPAYQPPFPGSGLRSDQQQFESNQQSLPGPNQPLYGGGNPQYPNPYTPPISPYQPRQPFQRSDLTQSWPGSNQNRGPSQSQGPTQGKDKLPKISKKIYPLSNIEELLDRFGSKNLYVNETKVWKYGINFFCIICGELGHIAKNCQSEKLKNWKRSHLRILIYGNRKINSVFVGFDEFSSSEFIFLISATSDFSSVIRSNSVCVEFNLEIKSSFVNNSVQFFLEKKSGPNKRAHVEDSLFIQAQPQSQSQSTIPSAAGPQVPIFSVILPSITSQLGGPQIPAQESAFSPPEPAPQAGVFFQIVFPQERPKKKGQKRIAKKVEMQPIVGFMDDLTDAYDKPVSIRNVLKQNKVDISLMD